MYCNVFTYLCSFCPLETIQETQMGQVPSPKSGRKVVVFFDAEKVPLSTVDFGQWAHVGVNFSLW